ncbi:MAG: GntR family transcriptional regulator, partial [Arcanobacterium sp.]|nr:GntR family transcriptional regulator [Arcanobacterium sp.]
RSQDKGLMPGTWRPKISLNRHSSVPLHEQISLPMRKEILSGRVLPGTRVENELSLAARLQVSRPTTRQAFQTLVDSGLLFRRRGFGTLVAPQATHKILPPSSLHREIQKEHSVSESQILKHERFNADQRAVEHLQCAPGTEVVELKRIRLKNGVPIAILHNLIPASFAPAEAELSTHGLYELFSRDGIKISSTKQSVSAQIPTPTDAKLLKMPAGEPVLVIDRTAFNTQGEIIEWGRHVYRGSLYRYESTVFTEGD